MKKKIKYIALAMIAAGFAAACTSLFLKAQYPGPRHEFKVKAGDAFRLDGERFVLLSFDIPKYPSGKPSQFESTLLHLDLKNGNAEGLVASVNHPVRWNGWWIYQMKYDGEYTGLVAFKDPWLGIAVAGGILLLAGTLLFAMPGISGAAFGKSGKPGVVGIVLRVVAAVAALAWPLFIIIKACCRAEMPPALQSWLFAPHVGTYAASYVILLFAVFGIGKRMVPAGFFLMTAGLVSGAAWGKICWGDFWQYDPKEMWSLATWLVYAAYAFACSNAVAERWLRRFGGLMIILLSTWANLSKLFAGMHSFVK